MGHTRLRLFLAALCALLLLILGCGDSGDSGGEGGGAFSGGCQWNGNCSIPAPNGAYDCLNDDRTLVQCIDGNWEFVVGCDSFTQGNNPCTCKGGCGVDTTVCSFAFDVCGATEFDTCGPNATAVLGDSWMCVSDI